MSYHQFPNIWDILQGDLLGKIRKVIGSKTILNCECNCDSTTNVKVTCAYGGKCRAYCVVYEVMCI